MDELKKTNEALEAISEKSEDFELFEKNVKKHEIYLMNMLEELKEYQRKFSTWSCDINNNLESMTKALKDEGFKEILVFSDYRKGFLDKKIKQMEKYIEIIQKESKQLDSYDSIDKEFMNSKLRFMLLSLGYSLS